MSLNFSKRFSRCELKLLINLDFLTQYVPSTFSRQLKVKKDTTSLIDVKGFGRPMAFAGKEEVFQQWSKKTEAFSAYVIQESEMMLKWSAELETEITTMMAIDLEFLPTDEFGTRSSKPGVCVAADAYSTHDYHEF